VVDLERIAKSGYCIADQSGKKRNGCGAILDGKDQCSFVFVLIKRNIN